MGYLLILIIMGVRLFIMIISWKNLFFREGLFNLKQKALDYNPLLV